MFRKRLLIAIKLLLFWISGVALLAPEWPAFGEELSRLNAIVGLRKFDFLIWEVSAFGAKAEAILSGGHSYLSAGGQKELVLGYLALLGDVSSLEQQIQRIYSDPEISDPETTSRELQFALQDRREVVGRLQPIAEAIVQDQVASILVDEEFELVGQAWPPVMMHMSPLPSILIVSPRERIERIYGIPLVTGLDTPSREHMEAAAYDELDLSALVVDLGGLGTYPAMIRETSSINRLAEITAHEWAHHWLSPYPITLNYMTDAQIRTMNETTASIVGTEIGATVMKRYYPEAVPLPALDSPPEANDTVEDVPVLDFRAEMAETRIRTDELLEEGRVDEAEAYMEQRRRYFFENGYRLRKINQAYFAFHGAYADVPGEAGSNPIGPMLLAIREQSPSLRSFMQTMATVREFQDLEKILESGQQGTP